MRYVVHQGGNVYQADELLSENPTAPTSSPSTTVTYHGEKITIYLINGKYACPDVKCEYAVTQAQKGSLGCPSRMSMQTTRAHPDLPPEHQQLAQAPLARLGSSQLQNLSAPPLVVPPRSLPQPMPRPFPTHTHSKTSRQNLTSRNIPLPSRISMFPWTQPRRFPPTYMTTTSSTRSAWQFTNCSGPSYASLASTASPMTRLLSTSRQNTAPYPVCG